MNDGPLRDGLVAESAHGRHLGPDGVSVIMQRAGDNEGDLGLRPAPDFVTAALASELCVFDLHMPIKHMAILAGR
jgi:hypothetical protein